MWTRNPNLSNGSRTPPSTAVAADTPELVTELLEAARDLAVTLASAGKGAVQEIPATALRRVAEAVNAVDVDRARRTEKGGTPA